MRRAQALLAFALAAVIFTGVNIAANGWITGARLDPASDASKDKVCENCHRPNADPMTHHASR